MWEKLNDLNSKFRTIKQSKKEAKKMSATILQIVVNVLFFLMF